MPKMVNMEVPEYLDEAYCVGFMICFATLVAHGDLKPSATYKDTDKFFARLDEGCESCPARRVCLKCLHRVAEE